MPICYMLVGVPGSGKTTFINRNYYDIPYTNVEPIVTGTDLYIERIAEALELTYNEIFQDSFKLANKLFWDDIVTAGNAGDDIIIDRTNMSYSSRKRFFNALPGYCFEAIVFPVPQDHQARLDSRLGKHIPEKVIKGMLANFQMPSMSEGFDAVWSPEDFERSLQND